MSGDNNVTIAILAMGLAIALNIALAGNSIRKGLENAADACMATQEVSAQTNSPQPPLGAKE